MFMEGKPDGTARPLAHPVSSIIGILRRHFPRKTLTTEEKDRIGQFCLKLSFLVFVPHSRFSGISRA